MCVEDTCGVVASWSADEHANQTVRSCCHAGAVRLMTDCQAHHGGGGGMGGHAIHVGHEAGHAAFCVYL